MAAPTRPCPAAPQPSRCSPRLFSCKICEVNLASWGAAGGLFSDARRKTCYERGTISITYSNRLSIFPLQTDSNRYPCEFAFPIS